jgi:hypothetical protein
MGLGRFKNDEFMTRLWAWDQLGIFGAAQSWPLMKKRIQKWVVFQAA